MTSILIYPKAADDLIYSPQGWPCCHYHQGKIRWKEGNIFLCLRITEFNTTWNQESGIRNLVYVGMRNEYKEIMLIMDSRS
jgi:hypothetical protein